jgi:hypothetical protein
VASSTKPDQNSQQALPQPNESKDAMKEQKLPVSTSAGVPPTSNTVSSSSMLESTGGPLKTMIFENRNFKSGTVNANVNNKPNSAAGKFNEANKESGLNTGIELSKENVQVFGKVYKKSK